MRDAKKSAPVRIPFSVAAGLVSGAIAGFAVGAVVGPIGAGFGVVLGLLAGGAAGLVLETEGNKRELRTRELDAIIGVSGGDLGADRASLVPSEPTEEMADEERRRQWLAEWLTPPPPQAM